MKSKKSADSLLFRSVIIGFVGGLFGGTFSIIMYYFNFSEVAPRSYLFIQVININWSTGWASHVLSIIIASILSIILAIIYYGLFRKINSLWAGLLYGIILWLILFYLLDPMYPNVQNIKAFNKNTIISTICLFGLYGTFVGYSISHDYYDTYVRGK